MVGMKLSKRNSANPLFPVLRKRKPGQDVMLHLYHSYWISGVLQGDSTPLLEKIDPFPIHMWTQKFKIQGVKEGFLSPRVTLLSPPRFEKKFPLPKKQNMAAYNRPLEKKTSTYNLAQRAVLQSEMILWKANLLAIFTLLFAMDDISTSGLKVDSSGTTSTANDGPFVVKQRFRDSILLRSFLLYYLCMILHKKQFLPRFSLDLGKEKY